MRRHWLCIQCAHLLANTHSVPYYNLLGTPRQGLCSQSAHLWAIANYFPGYVGFGTHLDGKACVANVPTCRPLIILAFAVKRRTPPKCKAM